MIDTAFVEQRMRDVNPVPGIDDINDEELSGAVTDAHTRRAAIMQAAARHEATEPRRHAPRSLHRRKVWTFAAACVLILVTVGIAALALRISSPAVTDEPVPPTTAVEPSADMVDIDSLTWSRISLGTEGVGADIAEFHTQTTAIAEGGPGLVIVGEHSEPAPDDLADGGGGPGWMQGYMEVPTVWTSPDGYEWSQVPSGDDTIGVLDSGDGVAGIARRDDLLVVVAETSAWTSHDGLTWSRVPNGTFRDNVDRLRGVISGGPGFVAFGANEVSQRAAIWTSPDGRTWTRIPDDPTVFSGAIHAMTAGGPGLVAVGARDQDCAPVVWTSPDGYSWTRLPHDPNVFGGQPRCGLGGPGEMRIRDISPGGPGLVAVGSHEEQAAVWTSPDGVAWTRVPDDPTVFDIHPHTEYSEMTSVAAVGDGLVAVGSKGGVAAVWTSHDGFSWTDITDGLDVTDYEVMTQVIAGGPGVVILSQNQIETVVWIGGPSK